MVKRRLLCNWREPETPVLKREPALRPGLGRLLITPLERCLDRFSQHPIRLLEERGGEMRGVHPCNVQHFLTNGPDRSLKDVARCCVRWGCHAEDAFQLAGKLPNTLDDPLKLIPHCGVRAEGAGNIQRAQASPRDHHPICVVVETDLCAALRWRWAWTPRRPGLPCAGLVREPCLAEASRCDQRKHWHQKARHGPNRIVSVKSLGDNAGLVLALAVWRQGGRCFCCCAPNGFRCVFQACRGGCELSRACAERLQDGTNPAAGLPAAQAEHNHTERATLNAPPCRAEGAARVAPLLHVARFLCIRDEACQGEDRVLDLLQLIEPIRSL